MIGAGAAGTMAAIFAASAGTRVVLFERTRDGGRKILISGGGRCNVLPARLDEGRFVTDSSPNTIRTESRVTDLAPCAGRWRVDVEAGPPLHADAVIVATGGRSVPKSGSYGAGLDILRRLGHTIHPTYAALTPLRADPAPFGALAGVSLPVTLTARSTAHRAVAQGGFLFTHHGYSGPAVLDVSHVVVRSGDEGGPRARVSVQWASLDDDEWEEALRPAGTHTVGRVLRRRLPERLAVMLMDRAGIESSHPLSQLRREERNNLVESLVRGEIPWTGHEGYKKAEVTGGGVSLAEVDPKTMESRRCPGLHICGEALDAFGPIGGYNFLWAWATGRAAGRGASILAS